MRSQELQAVILEIAGENRGLPRPPALASRLEKYLSERPERSRTIYPDERVVLQAICANIDAEADGIVAWRKLHDIDIVCGELRPRDFNPIDSAVSLNVGSSTIAYYDVNDLENGGSGVLVEINSRIFVATTAHTIPAQPNGRIGIARQLPTDLNANLPNIISFDWPPDHDLIDVAYFEVEPCFVRDRLDKTPIPISRILPCGPGQPNHATFLCCYPADLIRKRILTKTTGQIEYQPQTWGFSSLLMPEDWGLLPARNYSPDGNIDMYIAYDRDCEVELNGYQTSDPLPLPFGLSGGGLWQTIQLCETQFGLQYPTA